MGSDFISFYFAASIGINILCFAFVIASNLNQKQTYLSMILVGGVLTVLFQYFTWQYHGASIIQEATYWLRLQTYVVVLSPAVFYCVFVTWTHQKLNLKVVYVICAVTSCFVLLNAFSPNTLRFDTNVELDSFTLFSGEIVHRLTGYNSDAFNLFKLFSLALTITLALMLKKVFSTKEYVIFVVLMSTIIMQGINAVLVTFIDLGMLNSIHLGGLPFTILNIIICLLIASSIETNSHRLDAQILKSRELENALSSLAEGVSSFENDQFYVDMMVQLNKVSGTKMVFLGVYEPQGTDEWVHTKGVIIDGVVRDNFSYKLGDLDPRLVDKYQPLFLQDNAYINYPEVHFFTALRIRGFMNYPIIGKTGQLEGSIILLYDKPHQADATLMQILNVFASRAGAEMQRKRLENDLRQMAHFDYQTKLLNLTHFYKIVKEQTKSNLKSNTKSLLITVDLAKFTDINRQYGNEFADRVLEALGARLVNYTNKNISVGRVGSDEFAILIKVFEGDVQSTLAHQHKSLKVVINEPLRVDDRVISLSFVAGAIAFPINAGGEVDVIRCAGIALNQAKDEKKDIALFDHQILLEIDRKRDLESKLEQAVDTNTELFAVYQPKVDATGKLIGAEALARWINETEGFIPPDVFIPLAEKNGCIDKLGYWMIETVCQQLNEWENTGFTMPGRVAINVSALQLAKSGFVTEAIKIIERYNIQPERIEFELTESGLLKNLEKSIVKLRILQDYGFTIALDDFGTGYSSLSYLRDLPLDVLKIDRSFVNTLQEEKACELARSIITIGHHMSMDIVAEGVETPEQVELLNNMGCDIFQGYYFAKPLNAADLATFGNLPETQSELSNPQ